MLFDRLGSLIIVPLGAVLAFLLLKTDFWMSRLYPWGLPMMGDYDAAIKLPKPTLKDRNRDLQVSRGKLIKIYERGDKRLLRSPETIVFGPDGTMYTLSDQGFLISLTDLRPATPAESDQNGRDGVIWTAETTLVKDLGCGRPLGAKFTLTTTTDSEDDNHDGSNATLYVADALLGLIRIQNPTSPTSKVEIVASKIFGNNGAWTRINYADDLTIGPKTGRVYFTDASEVASPRKLDMTYDVMYGSKIDLMRGPSGRLIQYDPITDELKVLAEGIWFANGVGVDADETYLLIGETFRLGISKYHLSGEKAGTMEYIVKGDPLNAYVDGVDCAWPGVTVYPKSKPYCYVANPSEVVPVHRILMKIPQPFDRFAKALLMLIPKEFAPHVRPYGGITVVDGATGTFIQSIEDPSGKDIDKITGVTVHNNKLYLGSLENNYIGVYSLS